MLQHIILSEQHVKKPDWKINMEHIRCEKLLAIIITKNKQEYKCVWKKYKNISGIMVCTDYPNGVKAALGSGANLLKVETVYDVNLSKY